MSEQATFEAEVKAVEEFQKVSRVERHDLPNAYISES